MARCAYCEHEVHTAGDGECEQPIQHGPHRFHRCLCLARPGASTTCPPQMDCQGGTLGYADIWYLQRGSSVRGKDSKLIRPTVLLTPPPAPRRRLTELEHDAAWHAVEGTACEEGADPGTVLAAVLRALNIDPPEVDEMAASLRRDGFGDDEITEILARTTAAEGAGA
ncbi:hypothetical protein ACTVZO_05305 [Streptomyces sp. IBSNAI002]|uniref:hypothetical protein n=1 Tax=Streptomyces sp. IBSNAI002 TaxID=3457500 RepID=UPI003FD088D5